MAERIQFIISIQNRSPPSQLTADYEALGSHYQTAIMPAGIRKHLTPEGIEDYSYTKDGKKMKGSQYKFQLEFLKKIKIKMYCYCAHDSV